MSIDGAFGSTGSIWTGVPSQGRSYFGGGTTMGLVPGPTGPVLVVEGLPSGAVDQMTRVLCVRFAPDGHPAEVGRWDGALAIEVSRATWANALACCPAPGGGTAVLVAEREEPYTLAVTRYSICEAFFTGSAAGFNAALTVPAAATQASQDPFSVRIVPDGTGYLVVSASHGKVVLCRVPRSGPATVTAELSLGGTGTALPGLYRLDLASVRLDGNWLAIALTAYVQHSGVGPVSRGVLLRADRNGVRDPAFGDQGVWVSPLTNVFRQFVCAGEFAGGLVGVQGRELVAFGIEPGGSGGEALNDPFAVSGVLQQDLGGALSSPQSADDATHTYLFARRQDDAVVGCRFDRQGTADAAFGDGGVALVDAAGEAATPAALALTATAGAQLMLATTRQVQGWDCDRIPALTALDSTSGRPAISFGAGGFALHSAVGYLAALGPDGSGWVTERRRTDYTAIPNGRPVGAPTALRRVDAAGRYLRTVQVSAPNVQRASIASLLALDDGSTLLGGTGNPGWIAKLLPNGTFDAAFGTGGVAVPRAGVAGTVRIVGVRADGRIAIDHIPDANSNPGPRALALLGTDGAFDATYAASAGGLRQLPDTIRVPPSTPGGTTLTLSASVTPFLEADGTIILALASQHPVESAPYVRLGLHRIGPDGEYDANFGLGVPAQGQTAAGRLVTFTQPVAGAGDYSSVVPAGVARMGGKLYVVASGVSGGMLGGAGSTTPAYGLLIVTRWQADGSADTTFGVQEAGFTPERVGYAARGVLMSSAGDLLVYGEAGWAETVWHSIGGGTPYPVTIIRRAEPALFRVLDPGGIDTAFGQGGAERLPVHEFRATVIAARLIPPRFWRGGDRVRFVCTDVTSKSEPPVGPTTTFGGVGQFYLGPPRILPTPLPFSLPLRRPI